MFWLPIAMAGAGLLKNREAAQQAADERKRQAEITRYSPWTGMTGHTVQDPSLIGDVMQGAMGGAMMGQSMDQQEAYNKANTFAPSAQTTSSMNAWNTMKSQPIQGSAGALGGAGQGFGMMPRQNPYLDIFGDQSA